jgi:hypothetical protein
MVEVQKMKILKKITVVKYKPVLPFLVGEAINLKGPSGQIRLLTDACLKMFHFDLQFLSRVQSSNKISLL